MKKCCLLLVLVVGSSYLSYAQTTGKGLDGSWQGTLEAGGAKLRLALIVTRSDTGYAGKIDSLDQGSSIPIDTIAVSGDSVRLELKAINGVFDGTLNKDRTELA